VKTGIRAKIKNEDEGERRDDGRGIAGTTRLTYWKVGREDMVFWKVSDRRSLGFGLFVMSTSSDGCELSGETMRPR